MDKSLALVAEANVYAQRAREQECGSGSPCLGAEQYVNAVEKLLAAIECFPCEDAETRRALQAACRPKLASYIERSQLLLRVAREEGCSGGVPSHPTHIAPDPNLVLHQQYILSQFQPLGSPPGPGAEPPAAYYFQPPPQQGITSAPNTEDEIQQVVPTTKEPTGQRPATDGSENDHQPGSASFDRLLEEFLNK